MAGYSSTPLSKKLGIKPGQHIRIIDAPENFMESLMPLPECEINSSRKKEFDIVHIFVKQFARLKKEFPELRKSISQSGMIWISWPKKSSKVETDLDENIIRNYGLSIGLVDVKVCAVDDVWSGLKFVIPVKDRKGK